MYRKYLEKITIIIFFCCAFTIVDSHMLHAQAGIQGTQSQVIKWLSVSALRSWFNNFGDEGEYFRRDRTTYISNDQIDGLCWPNEYNIRMKGVKCSKALWIGTTDFADPVSNITYPHKVVCDGPRAVFSGTEIFADDFTMVGKFNHPIVYVNNQAASARELDDIVDVEDENLVPDRMIYNTFHTSIGVSVTRKVLAFSQQYNDNYYIYEYTFKNTGIIDETNEPKLNKTLTGVVFWWQYRMAFPGESYSGRGSGDWFPAASSWGRNTINDAIGQDANHKGTPPNDFRAIFSYYGPVSGSAYGSPEGDIGLPGPNSTNVRTLAGTQFAGVVVLHVDKSPTDHSDDPNQPLSTRRMGTDNDGQTQPSQYNQAIMDQKYGFMTPPLGNPAQTHAEEVGKDPITGWPTAYANSYGNDAGGYASSIGFGPYTMAIGDSIKIVLAEAVSGINHDKIREVAINWFNNNTSQFILPKGYKNGGTTTDRNEYKNAWVFSGKDSLFQTFRRAIDNYKNNYSIPQPPPPPDKFEVNSGGDRIRLSWSSNAESWPNFNGYRIFRAEGRTDTTFDKIFECYKNQGGVVNSYDDKTAKRGFNYYYYIVSVDNGSTNPGSEVLNIPAHEPLVSSRYYTITNAPAYLTRQAGAASTFITKKFYCPAQFNTRRIEIVGRDTTMDKYYLLPVSVTDASGTIIRGLSVSLNGIRQIPASYNVIRDTVRFVKRFIPFHTKDASGNDEFVIRDSDRDSIDIEIISPVFQQVDATFSGDGRTKSFALPESPSDVNGVQLYDVEVKVYAVDVERVPTPSYTILKLNSGPDSLKFFEAPSDSDLVTVKFTSVQQQRKTKLSEIRIVPNPFNIRARNIQFGVTDPTTRDRLAFYNLPPECKIRIYTETGDLIETIDHNNGSGDDYWHSITSSKQIVVSGLYIAYFEVTNDSEDGQYKKGDSIYKKFIIIR